jgi:hypothetical protein
MSKSGDGIHWQPFSTVIPQSQFPNNAANTGFSSDATGHVLPESFIFAFGVSPYEPSFSIPPIVVPPATTHINTLEIVLPHALFGVPGTSDAPQVDQGSVNVDVRAAGQGTVQLVRTVLYKKINGIQTQVQPNYSNQLIQKGDTYRVKFSDVCIKGETDFKVEIVYKSPPESTSQQSITVDGLDCGSVHSADLP